MVAASSRGQHAAPRAPPEQHNSPEHSGGHAQSAFIPGRRMHAPDRTKIGSRSLRIVLITAAPESTSQAAAPHRA
jgi:hypothetical protein